MVTIKDIAKEAGISYTTVSRALNGHPRVTADTRELVVSVANRLGYSPNAMARGLVQKSSQTIGIMVPDISNPYYPHVVRGVQDYMKKIGYSVFLCDTNWDEDTEMMYLKILSERRIEGLIIDPVSVQTFHNIRQRKLQFPVIFVGNKLEGDRLSSYVMVNNVKGAYMATEYLIKLGHTNIAFIGGNKNTSTNMDRYEGYRLALEDHGLQLDERLVEICDFRKESGFKAAEKIMKTGRIPTAVFAASDLLALDVMDAFEKHGYRIPEDVSVIGFDDIDFASLSKINLTTIAEPKYEIGRITAEILMNKISPDGNVVSNQVTIEPRLVIRGTCRSILL